MVKKYTKNTPQTTQKLTLQFWISASPPIWKKVSKFVIIIRFKNPNALITNTLMAVILLDARQLKNNPDWLMELAEALNPVSRDVLILEENGEKDRKKHYKEATIWVNLGHDLPRDWQEILEKGAVAVIKESVNPIFENYSPDKETGNSFLFDRHDKYDVFAAIIRALENHKFPYDWQNIKGESKRLVS